MSQVIIYSNSNGGVSVTVPSGDLPINAVLTKDCPAGAIIVDDSTLPQGADAQFFGAWRLNGSTVTVDFAAAQASKLSQYNAAALAVAQKRQLNTLAGLSNTPDDADWLAQLTSDRASIAAATTTAALSVVLNPS
jgi:hypothetical protein